MGTFDRNASTITILGSLAMILATVVIMSFLGKATDGQMQLLIGGAIGVAGAVSGFLKHSDTPPPGGSTATVVNTPPDPTQAVPPLTGAKENK